MIDDSGLEERLCACGCGNKFKALQNSPQKFWAARHDPNFKDWWQDPEKQREYLWIRRRFGKQEEEPEEY